MGSVPKLLARGGKTIVAIGETRRPQGLGGTRGAVTKLVELRVPKLLARGGKTIVAIGETRRPQGLGGTRGAVTKLVELRVPKLLARGGKTIVAIGESLVPKPRGCAASCFHLGHGQKNREEDYGDGY